MISAVEFHSPLVNGSSSRTTLLLHLDPSKSIDLVRIVCAVCNTSRVSFAHAFISIQPPAMSLCINMKMMLTLN